MPPPPASLTVSAGTAVRSVSIILVIVAQVTFHISVIDLSSGHSGKQKQTFTKLDFQLWQHWNSCLSGGNPAAVMQKYIHKRENRQKHSQNLPQDGHNHLFQAKNVHTVI